MKKLLFILFILPSTSFCQEFEVNLSVSADNVIRDRAISSLSRLLREFNEVTLTDDPFSHYEIRIIIIESSNNSGYKTGYAASLVVLKPLHPERFVYSVADKYVEEHSGANNYDFTKVFDKKAEFDSTYISNGIYEVFLQTSGIYIPIVQNLLIDSDLYSLCERIVASIDVDIFEPERKKFDNLFKD